MADTDGKHEIIRLKVNQDKVNKVISCREIQQRMKKTKQCKERDLIESLV